MPGPHAVEWSEPGPGRPSRRSPLLPPVGAAEADSKEASRRGDPSMTPPKWASARAQLLARRLGSVGVPFALGIPVQRLPRAPRVRLPRSELRKAPFAGAVASPAG